MVNTNRKPASVGEILKFEFMEPLSTTQQELAETMNIQCSIVSNICDDKDPVTENVAILLARRFSNSPEFWMNTQERWDKWMSQKD